MHKNGRKKAFLTKDTRQMIIKDFNNNLTLEEVANKYKFTMRKVRDLYKRYVCCTDKFTNEETFNMITLYLQGMKISQIAKIIKTKTDWQIRNEIIKLEKEPDIKNKFKMIIAQQNYQTDNSKANTETTEHNIGTNATDNTTNDCNHPTTEEECFFSDFQITYQDNVPEFDVEFSNDFF